MSKTAESSQAATFTIQNKTDQTNTATWKTYSNPQYAFIFKYPQNWVVEDEGYHETAGGCRADVPSLALYEQGKEENLNDWIRVNPRQFMREDGRCLEIRKHAICTYSTDAAVPAAYNHFVADFTLQPTTKKR